MKAFQFSLREIASPFCEVPDPNHPQPQLWMIMVTTWWRGLKSRQDSLLPEWIIKRTSLSADDSDEFPDHLKVIGRIEF